MSQQEGWHVQTTRFFQVGVGIESRPHGGRGLRLMTLRAGQQPAWLESFTRGLAQLKREGAYEQLLVKWGLPLSSPST